MKKVIKICFKFLFIIALLSSISMVTSCKKKQENNNSGKEQETEHEVLVPNTMICNQEYEIEIDTDKFEVEIENKNIIEHVSGKTLKAKNVGTTKITIKAGLTTYEEIVEVKDQIIVNLTSQMVYNQNYHLIVETASSGKINDYNVVIENSKIVRFSNGYFTPLRLGNTSITITYGDLEETIEVEIIDELYLQIDEKITDKSLVSIICSNAQKKKMTDAILESSNPEVIKINSLTQIETLSEGKTILTLTWNGMTIQKEVEVVRGFNFTYEQVLPKNGETSLQIVATNGDIITDYSLVSNNEEVVKIDENKQIKALSEGKTSLTVNIPGFDSKEIEIICASISLSISDKMTRNGIQNVKVVFNPSDYSEPFTIESSDLNVLEINNNKIKALTPGSATITVTTQSGFTESMLINVSEIYYSISFDLSEEDKALLPVGFIDNLKQFAITDLPISLPVIEKDMKSFLGWSINNSGSVDDLEGLYFEIPEGIKYNITLTTVWGNSRIELYHESVQVIEPNKTLKLLTETFLLPANVDKNKLTWESENENIATVENGIVTGISDGCVLIKVSLTDRPNINTTIGVTIMSGLEEMDEILKYFVENSIETIIAKNIVVTGYQFTYQYRLLSSVTNYLYEPFVINNEYYPITNQYGNRPGIIYPKYYITVHDTASSASSATARAHAKYVSEGGGNTSWHYSSGNDGIFHQIPDNENAYHAGDGGRPYKLFNTNVLATTKYPEITISLDGYYEVNGTKTDILAPKDPNGKILSTKDINGEGIRTVIIDGYYYLGNTYYNETYHLISNAGGNNNSIGIETMVNQGSDIYYTWQKTAKLVAHLMVENNLTIDDVKPHHFFSGKNCPQTMRDNGLWPNFKKLVEFEYEILTKYHEYSISFESHNPEYLNNLGRVIKQDTYTKTVTYTITVTKNNVSKSVTLSTNIPGTIGLKEIK